MVTLQIKLRDNILLYVALSHLTMINLGSAAAYLNVFVLILMNHTLTFSNIIDVYV